MTSVFGTLKRIVQKRRPAADDRARTPRRRDPPYVGGSSVKDIEEAPPGRAQELAGHAVERVET